MNEPLSIAVKPAPGAALVTGSASSPPSASAPSNVAPAALATPTAAPETAPVSLEIGTTVGATLIAAAPGNNAVAVGSRFELRLSAAAISQDATNGVGTIALATSGDTIVDSPLGALVLDRRLALEPGTTVNFQLVAVGDSGPTELPPSLANGWPALDQILSALDKAAPELATQLRSVLTPATAPSLAASLMFLSGTLYSGKWPGDPIMRSLGSAGLERLRTRVEGDLAGLRRLGAESATGDWRVLTLPLLMGGSVAPVRLYLRRKEKSAGGQDSPGQRFIVEAELSRLGALQLDGLVRGNRLDLVLRSHAPLPQAIQEEAGALFRRASAAAGYHGDVVFATASAFAVDPMTELRGHVAVRI
ncbi:MAG TPA: hypothetical protein VLV50_15955 [Stellaceae bacterium]|nr:hypothetical protein [Stellaceae bacterium]